MVKYGPILKKFRLKCQKKFEILQNEQYKKSTRKILVTFGEKITKVNFLMNFVRELEQKISPQNHWALFNTSPCSL
jgi:hypothetical protein